ncbi:MAG: ribosomal RNA small subunit methyltransferase A [Candidatus Aminicenantes bacterium]|nr:ribosomal RNA small subunit methyltransferase A [Candidatus Aminicenantes bacterium]NIM79136.1 ribosomal RNA small subunit methyltransferase A [Candidatus Aminicenantes bacterium]NIN18421.1 ribosomal RNA small subunit methyltransferase A [Candidatus Aminicenantes bacterium]NIN42309.1 ribosomal RNA small subunit methyltransferase A [Candidatus Aminicenantes bacterium]NIO81287.1 ribosomal RNA small subunit methyltransferase A [Candidatus Aminicenantes bacterium]
MKRAKLGQNFLVNRHVAEKMVKKFLPVNGPILEIGPGKGILTQLLITHCRNNRIITIELDKSLFSQLKEKYIENEGFEILNQDILKTDFHQFFPNEDETVNIIGNVPYYISKELLDWVIHHRQKIKKGMFMMQKEFVDKLTSGTGSKLYNAQSVLFNGVFRVEKMFDVQPGSFSPPPRVKSTVFLFERVSSVFDAEINTADFYRFLRRCFRNRRKTLFNNLASIYDTGKLSGIFSSLHLDSKVRAEQLILENFLGIYRLLCNKK